MDDGGLRPQGQALEGLGIPEEVERELQGRLAGGYQQGRLLDRIPVGPGARRAERSRNHLDRSWWIPERQRTRSSSALRHQQARTGPSLDRQLPCRILMGVRQGVFLIVFGAIARRNQLRGPTSETVKWCAPPLERRRADALWMCRGVLYTRQGGKLCLPLMFDGSSVGRTWSTRTASRAFWDGTSTLT